MHLVLLSEIVCGYHGRSVVGILSTEHTAASESLVFKCQVEGRSDVLGRKDLDVGFFLFLSREQCAPVCKLSMRSLRVVLWKGLGRVCVWSISGIEDRIVFLRPLEVVVILYRRTAYTEPCRIYILLHERKFREVGVVCGIDLLELYISEIPVLMPHYDPLVMHRIRNRKSLEDSRSSADHAVLVCLDAVFSCYLGVGLCNEDREHLSCVLLLAFLAGERCIPCVVGSLSRFCRVLDVKRIKLHELESVASGHERITDLYPCKGVLDCYVVFVEEWIFFFQRIRNLYRVPCCKYQTVNG